MKLSRSAMLLASAWLMAMLLPACSSSSEFGGAIGIGKKKADTDESSGEEEEDGEVDEPQQVAGAFLACSYMDSKDGVIETVKSGPSAEVEIGCGFFSRSAKEQGKLKKRSLTGASVNWKLMMGPGKYDDIEVEDLPESHQLSARLKVPVLYMAGTIHVEVRDDKERLGVRRKSIPSIITFDAENDFDGEEYFSLTSGQPVFDPAANTFVAASKPKDTNDEFMMILAQALIDYKAPVTQPVTMDRGDTVYKVNNDYNTNNNNWGSSGGGSGSGSGGNNWGKSGSGSGGNNWGKSGSGSGSGSGSTSGGSGSGSGSTGGNMGSIGTTGGGTGGTAGGTGGTAGGSMGGTAGGATGGSAGGSGGGDFSPVGSTNMGQGSGTGGGISGSGGSVAGSAAGAASGGGDGGGSSGGSTGGSSGGTSGGGSGGSGTSGGSTGGTSSGGGTGGG